MQAVPPASVSPALGTIQANGLMFGISSEGVLSAIGGGFLEELAGGLQKIVGPDKTLIVVMSNDSFHRHTDVVRDSPYLDGVVDAQGYYSFKEEAQKRWKRLNRGQSYVPVLLTRGGDGSDALLGSISDELGVNSIDAARRIIIFQDQTTVAAILGRIPEIACQTVAV